jgi:hypothetical protein
MNSPGEASGCVRSTRYRRLGRRHSTNFPLLRHRNCAAWNRYRVQLCFAYAGLRFEESQRLNGFKQSHHRARRQKRPPLVLRSAAVRRNLSRIVLASSAFIGTVPPSQRRIKVLRVPQLCSAFHSTTLAGANNRSALAKFVAAHDVLLGGDRDNGPLFQSADRRDPHGSIRRSR